MFKTKLVVKSAYMVVWDLNYKNYKKKMHMSKRLWQSNVKAGKILRDCFITKAYAIFPSLLKLS